MNTSYFAKYKHPDGVCIAIGAPADFIGEYYPALFPHWSFLSKYFKDGNEEEYTREYYAKVLSKLDPEKVYADLKGKTILCWEGPGKFCHRHIVAKWLKDSLGIDVKEL